MSKKRWFYLAALLVLALALMGPPMYTHFYGDVSNDAGGTSILSGAQNSSASGDAEAPGGNASTGKDDAAADKRATGRTHSPERSGGSGSTPFYEKDTGKSREGSAGQQKKDLSEQKTGPKNKETSGGCKVWIAVVGKKGELLFGPSMVTLKENSRWGITALGALEATGLSFTTNPYYGDFVTSVEGQKNEGMSGWMYKVNDRIPSVSAGEMSVEWGDKVIWWYSAGSNFEGPSWDSLKP